MCVRRAVPSASFSFQDEVSARAPGSSGPPARKTSTSGCASASSSNRDVDVDAFSLGLEPLPRHGLLPPTFADSLGRLYSSSKLTEVIRHANAMCKIVRQMLSDSAEGAAIAGQVASRAATRPRVAPL
jgi:hypothetical protein